jgi:hypothetical protein
MIKTKNELFDTNKEIIFEDVYLNDRNFIQKFPITNLTQKTIIIKLYSSLSNISFQSANDNLGVSFEEQNEVFFLFK